MATTIQNLATVNFTYNGTPGSAVSNVATATLEETLSATKTVLGDTYRPGAPVTYVLNLRNAGATTLTGVTVSDNLGAYVPTGGAASAVPLTYTGPAAYYLNGTFVQNLTPTATAPALTFSVPDVPAGGIVTIIYRATPNAAAPVATGGTITNSATVQAAGLGAPVTDSATVTVAQFADVRVVKAMSPDPVTSGDTLTYTFTLYNYGNTPATDVVLTDNFDPVPSNLTVTLNGAPLSASDYTYAGGTLTVPAGSTTAITIPAATATQDPATGAITVVPGTATLTATGVI